MFRKSKKPVNREKGGIELAGEAVHLLRTAPAAAIAAYYTGALPFVLAFLYFCSDMSRNPFAGKRCLAASLGLALAFLWMKCWQAVFADGLMSHITGRSREDWSAVRVCRMISAQTILQPYGLLLIPVSFILMLPFYCTHSFFQNVTALGNGTHEDIRTLAKHCRKQAMLWPKQNHVLIWLANIWMMGIFIFAAFGTLRLAVSGTPDLYNVQNMMWFAGSIALITAFFLPLCPLGWAVAGNVALTLVIAPGLLKSFLDIDSSFTIGGWHAIFSTTFIMSVFAITYLAMDPLVKTFHILRCFYGDARTTGKDIVIELESRQ